VTDIRILHIDESGHNHRAASGGNVNANRADATGASTLRLAIQMTRLETQVARQIQQTIRSLGGDGFVTDCNNGATDRSDVLLIGELRTFHRMMEQIKNPPLEFVDLAEKLNQHMSRVARPVSFEIDCGSHVLRLSERTHVMGVLNVTPDSFSDGGQYFNTDRAVERACEMAEEGADIIDIGGESTRPGSDSISAEEELDRVIPVIQRFREQVDIPISIDTTKSIVAREAIKAGAHIVNDISALRSDPGMATVVAEHQVPLILMHMKGLPKNMQKDPTYVDLIGDIYAFLDERVDAAVEAGIARDRIIVDPGIGFGKTWPDNFILLNRLKQFHGLGCPLLVGVSRKSFIGWALNLPEDDRVMGTAAAVAASVLKGVHIVRVHDVKEMVQVVQIVDRIRNTIPSDC
jgi:dihydropteroate synthase